MKKLLIFTVAILFISSFLIAAPQNAEERLRMERAQIEDRDPVQTHNPISVPIDDIFDLLDNFAPYNQEGEYPVATDGDYIYTARWNSTEFYRYDLDGTYVGEFTITGAGNLRDLTYDGEYFYASDNSSSIYEMDFADEVLVSTITTTVSGIRSIAYDAENDGFWVGDGWSPGSLQLVDRTGSNIETLPITLTSISGMAWENVLEDGPYLWAYCQNNNNNDLTQIDLETGATIQTFDVTTTGVIPTGATSGGLVITDDLVTGKWVFLGIAQNEMIWVLELADAADPESPAAPTDFVVTPDAGGALEAELSWTNPDLQVNGDPLTDLDAIYVYRGEDIVYTDNNPTIGGTDSYTDTVTESGLYTYMVVGENANGEGIPAVEEAWVGEDVPAAVEDLTLSQPNPNVLEAELTWDNPTEGLHGGAFNEPILGYHIERSDGETFDLTGVHTSFTDDTISEVGYYHYDVTPYNSVGDGGAATSNSVLISDAGLLVMEDFSGVWPPDGWEATSTGANINWEQSNTNNAGGEAPEARFYWSPSGVATQRLITPELDTSGHSALILEFRNFNNDFGGGYDLRLETTSDGVDWTTFETFPASDFGPQLEEIVVQTPDVGSETFQIAWTFDGDSWDINWWCIDDVMLVVAQDDGYLEGTVTLDGGDGDVEDVEISVNGITTNPDATGFYSLDLYPGTYDVTASLYGYQTETEAGVVIIEDEVTEVDFTLGNIDIDVIPASFNVAISLGEIITETMTISNPGAGDLEYSISIDEEESRVLGFRERRNSSANSAPMQRGMHNPSFDEQDPRPGQAALIAPTDDIFDLIDHFPVGVGGGEYSVTTDGDHIYTAAWNSTGFYRYETDGSYIGEFTIAGAGNLRDLTYDGEYFYASPNSNTIYEMDLDNEELIGQFTTTATSSIRGLAYDPDHDGFWVSNNWDPPLTLIDRNGTTISTITTTASSFSGLGWENVTDGGPHLWAYTQELGTQQNNLVQIDITNGSTIQTFDVTTHGIIAGDAISGGMDITDELIPGLWTFIGTSQNDVIWIIELGEAGPEWLVTDPVSGIVPAGESVDIDVIFDATDPELEPDVYNADIVVDHNAPEDPIIVPATMAVDTGPIISVDPESFDVSLSPDELLEEELTISNIGGEDLTFDIELDETLRQAGISKDRISLSLVDANSRVRNERERVDWLSVDPESGTIEPGDEEIVIVSFDAAGLEPDTYTADITITHNAGDPIEIPVTMEVEVPELPMPVNLAVDEEEGLFTWDEPELARQELLEYDVYLDGEYVATTEETEYQYEDLEYNETYEAGVVAVYNWGDSEMATVEFTWLVVSADDPITTITELRGNYPNPFNPDTNISFSLSTPGRVQIEIFNIRGEKVRTLLDSELEASQHEIVWDGRDDRGRTVSSGVFFYRMKTEDYTSVKKMLLMK